MLFNSLEFLIFFPTIVVLYFLTPARWRWVPLLVASYYFYMSWKAEYLFLILLTTAVAYVTGLRMEAQPDQRRRRKYLWASLVINLGILFVFKYFNFFFGSLNELLGLTQSQYEIPYLNVLLPVGISFYTFQTLSYSIDVYRGRIKAEPHFGIFALYVSFFPQLVAGPIERASHLLPQFRQTFSVDWNRIASGLGLMLWGLFKKIVVADRLAQLVNQVYNAPTDNNGITLMLATFFFAFQIYCDFSGYSDIAVGAARVMGFDLMENFNLPYLSKSIAEFWRRWHISLSTWFRDYVYFPLGGNRVSVPRWTVNVLIVFLVSGLWHGASWTFVVWGSLHGLYMVIEGLWARRPQVRLNEQTAQAHWLANAGKTLFTFLLVCFAWIFFRANSLADALYIVTHLFDFSTLDLGIAWSDALLGLLAIFLLEFFQALRRIQFPDGNPVLARPWIQWGYLYALIFSILLFGVFSNEQFIYFQF